MLWVWRLRGGMRVSGHSDEAGRGRFFLSTNERIVMRGMRSLSKNMPGGENDGV